MPRQAPPPPLDGTPEADALMQSIEDQLQRLDFVVRLRQEQEPFQSPTSEPGKSSLEQLSSSSPANLLTQRKWLETRPYANFPREKLVNHLTAGVLRGPGRFAAPPLIFSTRDNKESYILLHLGTSMCGHEGIIHGGLLATLMDEGMARPALLSLPAQIGVTANLNLDYKSPCFSNQFVVLHVKCTSVEGRKAFAEGSMKTLKDELLVQAKALFVQPKMAQMLSNSTVKAALGVGNEDTTVGTKDEDRLSG